ncbi:MAG TPA: nodulation protein NfeD [Bryobacteraceae bacterium]|nr:nodulation protein NfeD [Bryobacteraceae bacterium]
MRRLLLLGWFWIQTAFPAAVVRVDFDCVIHPVTVEMLGHALDQAAAQKADLVIVRLDTPGGLMAASRDMVQRMMASPVPVVAYVAPGGARAASAGFFLLLASDVAAMAPGTRTGAASPVILGQELDPVMRRKIESDAGAWMRSLAEQRGRNAQLAEKAVSEAKSFTDKEALAAGLVDLIADGEADLLRQLDGRRVTRPGQPTRTLSLKSPAVTVYEPTWRETVLKSISDPNVAILLVLGGALALYIEFSMPGLIAPGVLGGILLLLGLAALSVLPINWLGAALILLALALFVLEAKIASHGILGVGGAVALVLGAMMLVEGPPEFRISLTTALGVGLPFAAISVFLATLVFRSRQHAVETGNTGMVGEIGFALTPLAPSGKVFVHGEYWNATSSSPVGEGARIRVRGVDGLHVQVEPVESSH